MRTIEITVHTGRRSGLFDITRECEQFVADALAVGLPASPSGASPSGASTSAASTSAGARDGLLNVFVPHATAGLVVMELGAGSDTDLMTILERLLPRDSRWTHQHGSPGHGADHVLPLLAPPSITVPVIGGRLDLGTWQSIALLDTNVDNDRRRVRLSFLPG